MIRKAFLLSVAPEAQAEYKLRHQHIWPELLATFQEHGVRNYSIYLDSKRSLLFGTVAIDSAERWQAIARTDVCRRWWAPMRDIMPTNPDDSPVTEDLEEVFHAL